MNAATLKYKNKNLNGIYEKINESTLSYSRATHVPVGEDQIHHLELTRDLAKIFNNKFNFNFPRPKDIMGKNEKMENVYSKQQT